MDTRITSREQARVRRSVSPMRRVPAGAAGSLGAPGGGLFPSEDIFRTTRPEHAEARLGVVGADQPKPYPHHVFAHFSGGGALVGIPSEPVEPVMARVH